MSDLEAVIEDSLSDATLPIEETPTEEVSEAPHDSVSASQPDPEPVSTDSAPPAEATPATPDPAKDDFEKKFGIPAQSVTGRENRIPYSRVKKITEKAVADAKKDWETTSTPKLQEYETKVKDYETKFKLYNEFEQIMVNDASRHLRQLSTLPAYKPFFEAVEKAFANLEQRQATPDPTSQPQAQVDPSEEMPQPDQKMSDGSMVYSMKGLKDLMDWQARQVESKVTKQYQSELEKVQERYKPIEDEWQTQQRIQAVYPVVQAQIAEARTWKLFNENEAEITKVLQTNPKMSLETAYHRVVDPKIESSWQQEREKLSADRNKIREELLAELKQAPKATSAPTAASRSTASASSGPRSLEDVIREAAQSLK